MVVNFLFGVVETVSCGGSYHEFTFGAISAIQIRVSSHYEFILSCQHVFTICFKKKYVFTMTSHIEFSVDIVVYSIWENTNVQSESLCNVAYHFVYYIGF